jgi:hypothetical protein
MNNMKIVKNILMMLLIGVVSFPCFGSSVEIKRKKNKWLFPEGLMNNMNVNGNNQREILLFIR